MGFLNKLKELFTDVEEIDEVDSEEELEEEKNELPKVMREAVLEEEKKHEREEIEIKQIPPVKREEVNLNQTREQRFDFSRTIEKEFNATQNKPTLNVIKEVEKPKKVADLYQDDAKEKNKNHFKASPVISPVYGVLDKNYTKEEVMEKDDASSNLKRPSKKVDFETVRKKAFGNLTDEIKDNLLCENCELLKEARRNATLKEDDLLYDISKEAEEADNKKITMEKAIENYEDFGVAYEIPKEEEKIEKENNDIKIVNHNDEEAKAEQIEMKEVPKVENTDASSANKDDLFDLIDSMYEDKED